MGGGQKGASRLQETLPWACVWLGLRALLQDLRMRQREALGSGLRLCPGGLGPTPVDPPHPAGVLRDGFAVAAGSEQAKGERRLINISEQELDHANPHPHLCSFC